MNHSLEKADASDHGLDKQLENTLPDAYQRVRQDTLVLTDPLDIEDYGLQAMADVSPPKWHLAHTTWFFETFLLKPFARDYSVFHAQYEYLFNSYYNAIGPQFPRAQRGLLSRPTLQEVLAYRDQVDSAMQALLADADHPQRSEIISRTTLGLHHEQQHQELLCTDIKYSFSRNPLFPSMSTAVSKPSPIAPQLEMIEVASQPTCIGHNDSSFHFDNEEPAHRIELPAFRLANRLVSNADYLAFVEDGGYQQPTLWLADGWTWTQETAATHPLYWRQRDGAWMEYTLSGLIPLDPQRPVVHVNFYEADAYARWCNKRLPTEFEWEAACRLSQATPSLQPIRWHPDAEYHAELANSQSATPFTQWFGSAWQWTQSSYAPYPGYRPADGAIGEYNGKFMCNQLVLRGSSCVTPTGHARISYRNFFYPKDQWQFSGIRLADDLR